MEGIEDTKVTVLTMVSGSSMVLRTLETIPVIINVLYNRCCNITSPQYCRWKRKPECPKLAKNRSRE